MGRARGDEPPMPEPLAYFLTWSTYGTWLPGDERGWILYAHGWQFPDAARMLEAEARMTEDACRLDREQRTLWSGKLPKRARFAAGNCTPSTAGRITPTSLSLRIKHPRLFATN